MGIRLGVNQYGKAETHLVRVYRDSPRHEIRDLTVSTSLRGDFSRAHTIGDQGDVLPTDTQKNTVFAFAKERGVDPPERFGLDLAEHFQATVPRAEGARIEVTETAWERIEVEGEGHDHAFVQCGGGNRTAVVNVDRRGADRQAHVVSGVSDLVVLKSTGSEFHGFLKDRYTTLAETTDRILATALVVRWRHNTLDVEWNSSFAAIRETLLQRFAEIHSYALQQTLYGMGEAVLQCFPHVDQVKLSAPNRHHFVVDLAPFGLENRNEVFHAADRPYGLIEATVEREGMSDPGNAWLGIPGFV